MVRVMTDDMMPARPIQPIHEILSSVRMTEKPKVRTAPTKAHAAVQPALSVIWLKAVAMPSMPAPATAVSCSQ